jgi:hypothetical protein
MMKLLSLICSLAFAVSVSNAYVANTWIYEIKSLGALSKQVSLGRGRNQLRRATTMKIAENEAEKTATDCPEEVTKKYGLEAGIFTALTSKNKEGGIDAKSLLAKYGSAYLVTSITLSAISFAICYALVDSGIDVAALLAKIGITADGKTETAGTVAIAYAAHKAASPIRFPPTVALTPLTAKYLFNRKDVDDNNKQE